MPEIFSDVDANLLGRMPPQSQTQTQSQSQNLYHSHPNNDEQDSRDHGNDQGGIHDQDHTQEPSVRRTHLLSHMSTDIRTDHPDNPDQDHEHEQDTTSALNTLFAASHDPAAPYHIDLAIGSTLQQAAADQEEGNHVPTSDRAGLDSNDLGNGHGHDHLSPPPKRKATSRAHMLARGGACEFCKRRKLKCSAEVPQCLACRRSGRECVYSQKKQRSRVRVLEDRLVELERKLDQERRGGDVSGGNSGGDSDAGGKAGDGSAGIYSSDSIAQESPSTLIVTGSEGLFSFGLETPNFTLADVSSFSSGPDTGGGGIGGSSGEVDKRAEPDLMTLADAAAADGGSGDGRTGPAAWEGLAPAVIVTEIVKALEGGKGLGEKIIAHLVQLYAVTEIRLVHWFFDTNAFVSRLSPGSTDPPHPALLAALIPVLISLSPSPTLSSPTSGAIITEGLLTPSRLLSQHALLTLDVRVLDLVAASALRSITLFSAGRFVDGWIEKNSAVAIAMASGLAKLGGVGEPFAGPNAGGADRRARVEREAKLRTVKFKSQIVPPPTSGRELGQRIKLFWAVYLCDRGSAFGWNWPCAIDENEITTPLPRDEYESSESLCDNTTLADFLAGRTSVTGPHRDTEMCAQVKAIALVYQASRLLDQPSNIATPEKTSHLLRITKRYMATLPPFQPLSAEWAIKEAPLNEIWMTLHVATFLLYSKEEVDAPLGVEQTEARDKAFEAVSKVFACIEAAYAAGDIELAGYDIFAPTIWYIIGRRYYQLANQASAEGDSERADLFRSKAEDVGSAINKLGDRFKFAEVHVKMLQNFSMNSETKMGEWARSDNVDP